MGVAGDLGLAADDAGMVAALRRRHAEPQRHYHDWTHVTALARGFAENRDLFVHERPVALAILYHDAIYDPASGTNEMDSAALLSAERAGEAADTLVLAATMVRATADHAVPAELTAAKADDCAAFLDLDLGILAAPPEIYDRYAAGVRAEYAALPDAMWRMGRAAVLSGFLAKDRLFLTDRFHNAWDEPARANIKRELDALSPPHR